MSNWPKISLKEVLEFIVDNRGKTVPTIKEDGIALIATNCVNNTSLYPEFKNIRNISEETFKNWFRAHPQPDDILFTLKGSQNGATCLVPEVVNFAIAQDMVALRVNKDKMDPYFLLAVLRSREVQYQIKTFDVSDVIPHFKKGDFDKLMLPNPPLEIQKAIGQVYIKIEKKKVQNQRINQTLEQMAQALFQSWFVDFDPVLDNAITQGNEIPEALHTKAEKRKAVLNNPLSGGDKGMGAPLIKTNPELAAQFPSTFTYNETLGKYIPEGWEVNELGNITTELRRGISPKYLEEGGVLVLNQKCIRNHEVDFSLGRRNDPTKKKVEGRLLQVGDMVVNSTGTGTLGRVANIKSLPEPTTIDSHVTVLRPATEKVCVNYFSGVIFSIEKFIEAMGEGSTGQTELSRARLSEVNVLLAPKPIQEFIDAQLASAYEKQDANQKQTETLERLREVLLPQLISGKVKVPEALLHVQEVVG